MTIFDKVRKFNVGVNITIRSLTSLRALSASIAPESPRAFNRKLALLPSSSVSNRLLESYLRFATNQSAELLACNVHFALCDVVY